MNKPSSELRVEFTECDYGWVNFTVSLGGQKVKLHSTDLWPCFDDFIEWLEKLVNGDSKSQFPVNEENRIRWVQYVQTSTFNGTLSIWCDEQESHLLRGNVFRMNVVQTFYEAFLNFTTSDLYDPWHWEHRTSGQAWEDAMGYKFSCYEILDYLLTLDEETAALLMYRLDNDERVIYDLPELKSPLQSFGGYIQALENTCPVFQKTVPPEKHPGCYCRELWYERYDKKEMRKYLIKYMESEANHTWGGSNLRLLRSYPVELALGMTPFAPVEKE